MVLLKTKKEKKKDFDRIPLKTADYVIFDKYGAEITTLSKSAVNLLRNPTDVQLAKFAKLCKNAKKEKQLWSWLSEKTEIDKVTEALEKGKKEQMLQLLDRVSRGLLPPELSYMQDDLKAIASPSKKTKEAKGKEWKKTALYIGLAALSPLLAITAIAGCTSTEEKKPEEIVPVAMPPEYQLKQPQAQEPWQEPKTPQNISSFVFALTDITAGKPLTVFMKDGSTKKISGKFIYAKAGYMSKIWIGEADTESTPHGYYDPSKKVFYAAVENGYKEVDIGDILLTKEGKGEIQIDWEEFSSYAAEAQTKLDEVRENYFDWLRAGSEAIGLPLPETLLNEGELAEKLSSVKIFFVYGDPGEARHPDQLILPPPTKEAETEHVDIQAIIHEYSHFFLNHSRVLSSSNKASPFGVNLMEGEASFFAALVTKGMNNEFDPYSYGDGVYIIGVYAHLLGAEKFYKACLTPNEVDLQTEMDNLLGEDDKHAKMFAYFQSGKMGVYLRGDFIASQVFLISLLGELEARGIEWKSAVDAVELLFYDPSRPVVISTFFERFQLDPNKPLLEQAQNGIQYFGSTNQPFDVRQALENAPQRLEPVLTAVPLLDSLDYTSYDLATQQVALALWRGVIEDFVDYWNGLSDDEKMSAENQSDLWWFMQTSFALAGRFGITSTNIYMYLSAAMGYPTTLDIADNEYGDNMWYGIGPVPPTAKTLHLSEWSLSTPYTGSLSQKIESGHAVLVPVAIPWTLKHYIPVGGGKDLKLEISANGSIILEFSEEKPAEISGLIVNEKIE